MLIRKLFKAEMAHNVPGAYTRRCHFLHGHSYKYEIFLESRNPNPSQMVADFKGIKEMGINDFFDSFDHAVMVWEKDPLASIVEKVNPERHIVVPFVPTAEMMAKAFFTVCQAIIETGPKLSEEKDAVVERVVVHETDTGYAVYRREDVKDDGFPDIGFPMWRISDGIRRAWKRPEWHGLALARLTTTGDANRI